MMRLALHSKSGRAALILGLLAMTGPARRDDG